MPSGSAAQKASQRVESSLQGVYDLRRLRRTISDHGDSAALRVIPGSHRIGDRFSETLNESRIGPAWEGRDVPAVTLQTRPGDVVIFDLRIKHASYGGGSWRRMFTISCGRRYPYHKLEELTPAGNGHFYGQAIVRTDGPRRMPHLEQVITAAAETNAERSRIASPARAVAE